MNWPIQFKVPSIECEVARIIKSTYPVLSMKWPIQFKVSSIEYEVVYTVNSKYQLLSVKWPIQSKVSSIWCSGLDWLVMQYCTL